MVASTRITPGRVQFLKNKKRFYTAWVNSAIWKISQSLPVYVQKQTILESALTSRSGHNRK